MNWGADPSFHRQVAKGRDENVRPKDPAFIASWRSQLTFRPAGPWIELAVRTKDTAHRFGWFTWASMLRTTWRNVFAKGLASSFVDNFVR
jgi:hypothetical protein